MRARVLYVDAKNPAKHRRPVAAGLVGKWEAIVLAIILEVLLVVDICPDTWEVTEYDANES